MGLKFLDIKKLSLKNKISNKYFLDKFETSEEWIETRTGIKNRFFSEMGSSEMAVKISENLNFDKNKVRLIIVASFTPDNIVPSIAGMLHKKMELGSSCMAFDINMACTGFVGAVILAEKYLNENEQAVIIATEKITDVLDFKDRTTAILFGDGSAGVVVEKNKKMWLSDERTFGNENALKMKKGDYLSMQGKEVYRFAVEKVPVSIESLFENSKVDKDEIKYVFPHQANKRILEQLSNKTGIDEDKFLSNVSDYGNTSAASIPILLAENYERLKENDKVIFSAFGAGLSICSILMEW